MKVANEWKPTILHDLHEAQQLLYASTGTGPYNEQLDPITIGEWWMFAQNDVMEMTKRGVPGVWTYGFYDGWTPNYMFYAVHTHNATGRFYEVTATASAIRRRIRAPPAAGGGGCAGGAWRGWRARRLAAVRGRGGGARRGGAARRRLAGVPRRGGGRRPRTRQQPRVVPSESRSGRRQLGTARAREHEPVGRAVRAELHRQGQGTLARELLDQEPERRRQGHATVRRSAGSSRRRSTARRTRPKR